MKVKRLLKFCLPALLLIPTAALLEPAVLWFLSSDRAFGALLEIAYGSSNAAHAQGGLGSFASASTKLEIDDSTVRARVDPRFLSIAIDTSQVVGGHWWAHDGQVELKKGQNRTAPFDFDRPKLVTLARELAPAYMRIGGTEADSVRYAIEEPAQAAPAPSAAGDLVLTRERFDSLNRFAKAAGHDVFFTLNAGPIERDANGDWQGRGAQALIDYARRMNYPVRAWELGNEVNVFWVTHGLGHHLSAERYARDLKRFRNMVRARDPEARLAAAAAFIWPVMGEPPPRLLPDLIREAGADLDVITWHYYPEQSRRCWAATRRARPGLMLRSENLAEFDRWADYVEGLRDQHAPKAEVWLGETGGAQCGGEPGISDRFASSLWWLDQLGRAAQRGQPIVVRQTLAGSHYGLIDDKTLEPRPDYWSSLLFKRLMGDRVLATRVDENNRVRGYAHCTAERQGQPPGSVTLLLINTDAKADRTAQLPAWAGQDALIYRVTAPDLYGQRAMLNGQPLRMDGDALPALEPERATLADGKVALEPGSYAFAVLPGARAAACL